MNPLSNIGFANIFSHSIRCLYILLTVSFAVQKHFIYFCFCCLCFCYHIQEVIVKINVRELFLYFLLGDNGNPLQYFCLENPMDGGAWWAIVHGVTKSRT